MLLTEDQRREYEERGFIVLRDVPEIAPVTERMVQVYQSVAEATPEWEDAAAPTNKFRTAPIVPGSYWSELDHSLPFLQVILHPQCLELAKQYLGTDDIYLRNAGINENAPGYSVRWHRDSVDQFWNGERKCGPAQLAASIGCDEDFLSRAKRFVSASFAAVRVAASRPVLRSI